MTERKKLTSEQEGELSVTNDFSGDGIYIHNVKFSQTDEGIEVTTHIKAPKKGDDAMDLLAGELQTLADRFDTTFIHVGNPTSKAAKKLLKRTPEYTQKGVGAGATWRKSFRP